MLSLSSYSSGSTEWARALPAGYAMYTSRGRWQPARHLMLVQQALLRLWSDDGPNNLIISMPPRHGKTEFAVKKGGGWWLGINPHGELVIVSYESTLATDFSTEIRDTFEEYAPDLWGLTVRPDKRAAANWRLQGLDDDGNPVTGGCRATGIGGGLTGRGGHFIIIDDPIKNDEQARSEVYREKVWRWYLSTLFTRREPGCRQLVVMTRWNEDDLAARLINRAEEQEGQEWEVLNLPAECEDPDTDPLGREVGEALWPERYDEEALAEIKGTLTPYEWGALFQGRPSPMAGNIFKRSWWRFWHPAGADESQLPPVHLPGVAEARQSVPLPAAEQTISSWDLTFKKGKATSYIAGLKLQKTGANVFLTGRTRDRWNFPETCDAFRAFHELHPDIDAKWVEDAANGPALHDQLHEEIAGILLDPPRGSKEDRARAVSSYVQSGNVYLPHPLVAPWVYEFVDLLAAFPNGPSNDDVDSFSQGLRKLFDSTKKPSMLWSSRHRNRVARRK